MANSGFVAINTAHNNGHGESVLLVSRLSSLLVYLSILLLCVCIAGKPCSRKAHNIGMVND